MTYQELKEAARQKTIDWQLSFADCSMSYGELADAQEKFTKLARRYGLTAEFRENGII